MKGIRNKVTKFGTYVEVTGRFKSKRHRQHFPVDQPIYYPDRKIHGEGNKQRES